MYDDDRPSYTSTERAIMRQHALELLTLARCLATQAHLTSLTLDPNPCLDGGNAAWSRAICLAHTAILRAGDALEGADFGLLDDDVIHAADFVDETPEVLGLHRAVCRHREGCALRRYKKSEEDA